MAMGQVWPNPNPARFNITQEKITLKYTSKLGGGGGGIRGIMQVVGCL